MKAPATRTQLFLDSGDPAESRQAFDLLGRLDGQTTNPSLIAKNPELQARLRAGRKLSQEEANEFYRHTLLEIEKVTAGPLSVEVYADETSTADDLLRQGREMFRWVRNAHVKYPITAAGLEAAERGVAEGMRVNMTLCFSQEQAAAVYAATRRSREPAFVSPFVGEDAKVFPGLPYPGQCVRCAANATTPIQGFAGGADAGTIPPTDPGLSGTMLHDILDDAARDALLDLLDNDAATVVIAPPVIRLRSEQDRSPVRTPLAGRPRLRQQVPEALAADRVDHQVDAGLVARVEHPVPPPGIEDPALAGAHVDLAFAALEPHRRRGHDRHVHAAVWPSAPAGHDLPISAAGA